jgi:hypothetical protein
MIYPDGLHFIRKRIIISGFCELPDPFPMNPQNVNPFYLEAKNQLL